MILVDLALIAGVVGVFSLGFYIGYCALKALDKKFNLKKRR